MSSQNNLRSDVCKTLDIIFRSSFCKTNKSKNSYMFYIKVSFNYKVTHAKILWKACNSIVWYDLIKSLSCHGSLFLPVSTWRGIRPMSLIHLFILSYFGMMVNKDTLDVWVFLIYLMLFLWMGGVFLRQAVETSTLLGGLLEVSIL